MRSDSVARVQVLAERWRPGSETRRRGLSSVVWPRACRHVLAGQSPERDRQRVAGDQCQRAFRICRPRRGPCRWCLWPACILCRLCLSWGSFARFDSSKMGSPRCISLPSTAGLSGTTCPVSTLTSGVTGSQFAGSCGLQAVHLLGFTSSPALLSALVRLSQLLLSPPGFRSHTVGSSAQARFGVWCSCGHSRTAIPNARANMIAESGDPCGTPLVHRTVPVSCHAGRKELRLPVLLTPSLSVQCAEGVGNVSRTHFCGVLLPCNCP